MERYARVAVGSAAAAAILSLLIGILAGVGFAVALVRALLAGVLFALLGGGAMYLLGTVLAVEGGTPGDDESQESDRHESGSGLDITVDDDLPANLFVGGAATEDFGSGAMRRDADDSIVDEVSEDVGGDAAETVVTRSIGTPAATVEIDDTLLDEIPDIGTFAGAFTSGGGDDGAATMPDLDGYQADDERPARQSASKARDAGYDPEKIARALQTMLKRDES